MINTDPLSVETIYYPFEAMGSTPILDGQYHGMSAIQRYGETMLGNSVVVLAAAHDRYDPLFEAKGQHLNITPEFTAFYNGFYAARQCFMAAEIAPSLQTDREIMLAIFQFLPDDVVKMRQPYLDGSERDRIEDLATNIRTIGMQSRDMVYPTFSTFFEEHIHKVDPSGPEQRDITLDPFIVTGAGWATLLYAPTIRNHIERTTISEVDSTTDDLDFDAELQAILDGGL